MDWKLYCKQIIKATLWWQYPLVSQILETFGNASFCAKFGNKFGFAKPCHSTLNAYDLLCF